MRIEAYTPDDYQKVSMLWTLQSWPSIPPDCLPKNGYLVKSDSLTLCAGFLYETDSSIAWLEFVVANPLCDKLLRDEALNLLITALLNQAKELGKTSVFTSTVHPKLAARYLERGAIKTDEGVTHFIWRF